jgi:hypothetical protein
MWSAASEADEPATVFRLARPGIMAKTDQTGYLDDIQVQCEGASDKAVCVCG